MNWNEAIRKIEDERRAERARSLHTVVRRHRFFTCSRHGWDALGKPCPECRDGDAPRHCSKHGWSHSNKGCPQCTNGYDA